MDKQLLDEVIACLPEGRTFFHYHRDRYVLLLIEELQRLGVISRVSELKRTPHAHWLQKGFVKEWLAAQGRADVPVQELLQHWPVEVPHNTYLLSLGSWERDRSETWRQTTRPGCNLVLHLNLPLQHRRQLVQAGAEHFDRLQWRGHPRDGRRLTLAWARIDLDLETGEALIEEIQSDWIRKIAYLNRRAHYRQSRGCSDLLWFGMRCDLGRLLRYSDALLAQQQKLWHEAMLAATLWFLWRELGIRRVFYHSWESGNALKQFHPEDGAPPRSLYTDLPERFGFRRVSAGPAFIEGDRHVRKLKEKLERQRKPAAFSWYHWAA